MVGHVRPDGRDGRSRNSAEPSRMAWVGPRPVRVGPTPGNTFGVLAIPHGAAISHANDMKHYRFPSIPSVTSSSAGDLHRCR